MNQGRKQHSDGGTTSDARGAGVSQATGSGGGAGRQDAGLVELLRQLAEDQGTTRAARRLGVDRKTLAKGLERQTLTPRLKGALETEREKRGRAEADAAEQRLARLEAGLQDLGGALRREWRAELRPLRADVASLREELAGLQASGLDPTPLPDEDEPAASDLPQRIYPELVTVEPAADDERVYGRAWPLVAEWRTQRDAFRAGWPRVAGREAEIRMLELELRLGDEQRLTLPPDGVPWNDAIRADELRRRSERLALARRHLRRARLENWLRRLVGLGRRGG